jgi:MFS family permease
VVFPLRDPAGAQIPIAEKSIVTQPDCISQTEPLDSKDQLRRLSVLIAVSGVDMIGFAMILPLLPFYALELKTTPFVIGWIISSFSVAQLMSAPMWGRVSDRHGRRPALLIGLAASAISYAVFGLANTVWLLFASRIIQGAGGGTTGIAQAYVADTVRPEDRVRAFGWLSAATSAGIMVGPAIGSFAARFGNSVPGLLAASFCLVNVICAWKWLPESRKPGERTQEKKSLFGVWIAAGQIIRRPKEPVPRLIWIYAVGMLAFSAMTSILSLYLGAEFGFTAATIGYVFLYIGAISLAVRSLCLGPINARIGEVWAMRLGTISLVLGFLAYPVAKNLWMLIGIIPFIPVGAALLFPATTALMSRASEKTDLGATMGIAQTYAGISRLVAPLLATFAFQHFGHATPFYFGAATVALVGILAFIRSR